MRTTCTHNGRTHRHVFGRGENLGFFAEDDLFNHILAIFTEESKTFLTLYVNTESSYELLDKAVKLLDNIECVNVLCKLGNKLLRKRIYHSEL